MSTRKQTISNSSIPQLDLSSLQVTDKAASLSLHSVEPPSSASTVGTVTANAEVLTSLTGDSERDLRATSLGTSRENVVRLLVNFDTSYTNMNQNSHCLRKAGMVELGLESGQLLPLQLRQRRKVQRQQERQSRPSSLMLPKVMVYDRLYFCRQGH